MKKKLPTNTVDFMNSIKVRYYIFENKKVDRVILFFGNNIKNFKKIYGEQQGVFTRERRSYYMAHPEEVKKALEEGTLRARKVAAETILEVRKAMNIDGYEDINNIKKLLD